MTSKTLICETEHVIAIEQDLGGDTIIVTFNEMGFRRNGLRFWADELLHTLRLSAIGIVTPEPNWYPRRAMTDVIAAVLPKFGHRRVITLGHGHGGYGALKFAGRLRASVALAVSPQWSIDPADVDSFDSRFAGYFKDSLANGHRIEQQDVDCPGFVLFDNLQSLSCAHAAKLALLRGVKTIRAPFFMREGNSLAAEESTLARLIELCSRESPPRSMELRQVIRVRRRESKAYVCGMLRQLVQRVHVSASHSTVFASSLLGDISADTKLFYSALLQHAKGNSAEALSELRRTTTQCLNARDLLPVWHLTRKLRFPEAELAVANELPAKLPANISACLCAVNTMIRLGEAVAAHHELMRLTKKTDAREYIRQFAEYSSKLEKPQILEELLVESLPRSARITVLFALVKGYLRTGARRNAFHRLMELAELCTDSPERQLQIAALFVELGEFSTALDIRGRLLRNAPDDYLLALEIVDVKVRNAMAKDRKRIHLELKKILPELAAILKTPSLPAVAWERASHLYDALGELNEALRTIRKAVDLPGRTFEMQQRLAVLLARKDRRRAARRQIEQLFAQNREDLRRLRILCGLAFWLKDRGLTRRLAEAQFRLEPESAESALFLARQLCLLGDQIPAQQLLLALFEKECRSSFISNQQLIRLAQGSYEAGDMQLTRKVLAEAAHREPNHPEVRKLEATLALTQRLGRPISLAPAQESLPELARTGFISRIRKIFRSPRFGSGA